MKPKALKSIPTLITSTLLLGATPLLAAPPAAPAAPAATPGLPTDQFTATQMAREGAEAFDKGDYKLCLEKLVPYLAYMDKIKITESLDLILFGIGFSQFMEKKWSDCITTLRRYESLYPKGSFIGDASLAIGKAQFFNKDYKSAISQFLKLKNDPQYKEQVLPMLAEVYKNDDQGGEAVKVLEEYLASGYNSTERINSALILAQLYLDSDQTDKGIAVIEKIKASPSSADYVIILNNKALVTANNLFENNPASALRAFQAVRWKNEVIKLQSARLDVLRGKIAEWVRMRSITSGGAAAKFEGLISEGKTRVAQLQGMVDELAKEEAYDAALVYSIGKCYFALKRNWEAELAFRKVVEKFPTYDGVGDAKLGQIYALVTLKRKDDARKAAWEFLEKFPKHAEVSTVSELIVNLSMEAKDHDGAKKAITTIFETVKDPPNKAKLLLLSAQVAFEYYDFAGAEKTLLEIKSGFPNDENMEEVDYRIALSYFFRNEFKKSVELIAKFLETYPDSPYIPDARYRLNIMRYGEQMALKNTANKARNNEHVTNFGPVIEDVQATIDKYPEAINLGELYGLIGDCYDQMNGLEAQKLGVDNLDKAAEAYRDATIKAGLDNVDIRDYAMEQARNKFTSLGRWSDIRLMFRTLIDKFPSHADRLKWLNEETKATARDGKTPEEKAANKESVKSILATEILRNINRPNQEGVEALLEQLVTSCVPRRKPRPAPVLDPDGKVSAVQPPPPPEEDAFDAGAKELDKWLGSAKLNETGKSRLLYAKYLMMRAVPGKPDPENPKKRLSREPDAEKMLDQLAQDFKAEDYSSSLLAVLGDHLMKKGIKEKAVTFYNRLIQFFPNSDYQDFGYVGLADIALAENDLDTAEKHYKTAIEKLAGLKYPNALLGLSKTQIARKIYTECSKYLDEIINVKDWKGPLHCEAFFLRGEVNRLMGNFSQAVNDYGRLFLSFAKFEEWAVKGYLGAEECHRAMGSPTQAANALKEAKDYLVKRKLETSPLMEMVRKRAQERGVPLN